LCEGPPQLRIQLMKSLRQKEGKGGSPPGGTATATPPTPTPPPTEAAKVPQELIDLLSAEIRARNWSPHELAKRAGINHPTVYDTLAGKNKPQPSTLRAFAGALGIPETKVLVAAGYMAEPPPGDSLDTLALEIARALRAIPEDQRSTAVAAIKGMLTAMSIRGE
jgi:transcriptional regulator with XRE-family HTH domain